ncbi:MAG: serine/threonine-protein kinase [Lysobacteraceae bacterium]
MDMNPMSSSDMPATDPDRFAALKAAFLEACETTPEERAAHLQRLHENDPALARELTRLLQHLDPADLAPPEANLRFGPFRVRQKIGEGGMGEVFLGEREDADFAQRVAIKRARRGATSHDLQRRFLRERQTLARLQHPGIARLIDGGIGTDGRAWLAMEYIEGETLMAYVRRHELSTTARVELLRHICAAVAYAHRNLVVHRDIKPGNVLITPEGEPKLLDFGIAQVLDDTDAHATRTAPFALTPRYAAPEQLAGERTTTATDVHALGLLLYELIAQVSPFAKPEDDGGENARAVLTHEPRPLAEALREKRSRFPRELWRAVTGDLDRIARKALAKAPSERYPDVAAFDADLDDWLQGRPLRSGIGSARAQTAWLLRRYRWPLALASSVTLALGLGAVLALHQAEQARQQARIAQEHLSALLDVLGSVNPQRYAGHDPVASEFLAEAAAQLARRSEADPELSRRALLEIGHGLINLGKLPEAESALTQALAAARREPDAGANAQLSILALLAMAQDRPDAVTRLQNTVSRIRELSENPTASTATVVDALARAAGVLARRGDGNAALHLFEQMQPMLESHPELPVSVIENAQRQRGWAALRVMDMATAFTALERAAALARAAPQEFSELRRAEAEVLLSHVALLRGDGRTALAHHEAARAAFLTEYAEGHPERAAFELLDARIQALFGDSHRAQEILDRVLPVLRTGAQDTVTDLAAAQLLHAELLALRSDCDAAKTTLTQAQSVFATLTPSLPRDVALLEQGRIRIAAVCP